MRTITSVSLIVLLFFVQPLNAGNANSLIQQLSAVNNEWNKQKDAHATLSTTAFPQNRTFNDWIATHLMLVEKTLRARETSHLTEQQRQNRLVLLDKLNGYWHSRAFPVNDYVSYKTPVFIDRTGNHCAVGFLMQQSGAEQLARQIDANEKFAYVHQIKTPGVAEWAFVNGFSIDELAWIQPGYPTTNPVDNLNDGVDGIVNAVVADATGQTVYVAGSFSESGNGIVCNNIAAWMNGFAGWDWINLGDGVNGTVHALLLQNNKLYVGGDFTMAGNVSAGRVAVYDLATGQWQSLGNLDSTVRALSFYNGSLYAGGDFAGYVSKWTGSNWQDVTQGFIYGEGVRALDVWNNELVIGGHFELATGALRKHVATYNGTQMGALGMGTRTPVNDFEIHDGKLYAACDVIVGNDTCALAVYENFDWHVELAPAFGIMDGFSGNSILKLVSDGNSLFAAGDFFCGSGMIFGNNLMEIKKMTYQGDTTVYTRLYPLAVPDQPVRDLAILSNTLYFGGEFITNGFMDTLNHVGALQLEPVSVRDDFSSPLAVRVFPNPSSDWIRIESPDGERIEFMELYDATGKIIISERVAMQVKDVSLSHFVPGVYVIRAMIQSGWVQAKVVKH